MGTSHLISTVRWTAILLVIISIPLGSQITPTSTGPENAIRPAATTADDPSSDADTATGAQPDSTLEFRFAQYPTGKGPGPWKDGCFRNQGSIGTDACIDSDGQGALSDEGGAIVFPDTGQGRAVVRWGHDPGFDPGDRDFTITATVAVAKDQVSSDSNIIQKGYFDTSLGQWKLQVDNGKPSCRIAGQRDAELVDLFLEANASIADQGLVALECRREGDTLTLAVDGTEFTSGDNATMNITNTHPVTLGGKGSSEHNDQLHGKVKEVSVTIG